MSDGKISTADKLIIAAVAVFLAIGIASLFGEDECEVRNMLVRCDP